MQWIDLREKQTGTTITSATASVELSTTDDVPLSYEISMDHELLSPGTYTGFIDASYTEFLIEGTAYYLNFTAEYGQQKIRRRLKRIADYQRGIPRQSRFGGVIYTTRRLWLDSDCDVTWEDLRDESTGDYIINATVTVRVESLDGVAQSDDIPLTLDISTTASYHGTIDQNVTNDLTENQDYYLHFTVTYSGATGRRRKRLKAQYQYDAGLA